MIHSTIKIEILIITDPLLIQDQKLTYICNHSVQNDFILCAKVKTTLPLSL